MMASISSVTNVSTWPNSSSDIIVGGDDRELDTELIRFRLGRVHHRLQELVEVCHREPDLDGVLRGNAVPGEAREQDHPHQRSEHSPAHESGRMCPLLLCWRTPATRPGAAAADHGTVSAAGIASQAPSATYASHGAAASQPARPAGLALVQRRALLDGDVGGGLAQDDHAQDVVGRDLIPCVTVPTSLP